MMRGPISKKQIKALHRASSMLVAILTIFCVTILNGYHVAHPDDHAPSHTQIVPSDHHASQAGYGETDRDEGDRDGPDQFASHSVLHAISLVDPAVLVISCVLLFASWYPIIVAVMTSMDPPGHLRPPRS